MTRLKAFLGYTLAILAVPLIFATFLGLDYWGETIVNLTGIKVSPWNTGGEVALVIPHGAYRTEVYEPVFAALIGQRRKGFVQIRWAPAAAVPAKLRESIDFDRDGQEDFRIELDTAAGKASLRGRDRRVLGLLGCYRLKEAWAVRVELQNERRGGR